jgi:hypothetical protein
MHFYLNWAKERLDEMDAALASVESKAAELQAESRVRADQLVAELRRQRDAFRATVEKQTEAGEAAWASTKALLESRWAGFSDQVDTYIESFGRPTQLPQAAFQELFAAQLKAWRDIADKAQDAASEFAAERRGEVEAAATRMKAEAAAAEDKLQKLARAGTGSWSALNAALAESRAAFDRANRKVWDAFN